MEYYSAIRRKQILPFATTWMELEGIMLSEISQVEKDKYQMISLIRGVKEQRKTEGTKQQQNHRTQEWTDSCQRERGWGGGVGREGEGWGKRKGALRLACIMCGGGAQGGLCNTEKTSNDSIASYYADGQ